jgi:hypothetical protein
MAFTVTYWPDSPASISRTHEAPGALLEHAQVSAGQAAPTVEQSVSQEMTVTGAFPSDSRAKSLRRPGLSSCRFLFSILRWCAGFERSDETARSAGDFLDRGQERGFVCLRRFIKAADFSHELERRRSYLLVSDGRIKVEECFDVPAHFL